MYGFDHCFNCSIRLMPKAAEIKKLRMQSNLTQREFATKLGITGSYIAYLEDHKRIPSYDLIIRMRKYAKQHNIPFMEIK